MKYFAALGIALLVIAAASVGPWAPSPFTSQTGTNTTAAAWRVALGVTSSASLTNAALVGGTVVNQTNTSLTAARVLVTDANKVPTNSAVTTTTLGYLDATSSIQTQLDAKPTVALTNLALLNGTNTFTGTNKILNLGVGGDAGAEVFKVTGNSEITGWIDAASIRVDGSSVFDTSGVRLDVGSAGGFTSVTLGNGDARVQVGGATSAFPALKRSTTNLHVKLADDSAMTGIVAGAVTIGSSGAAITSVLSATATLNFDLTALVVEDLTITVTGAASGDTVSIGVPAGSVTATVQFTGWVSAADTVTIRARTSVVGENPASGTFRATVTKF